jgi:uncharacterized protein
MGVKEQLAKDLTEAMKAKQSHHITVIRGIMAAFKEAEQKKREDLVKSALKKHSVTRPPSQDDAKAMAEYDKAVTAALGAEKVDEGAALGEGELLAVVQKLIKMRQDSIADAEKASRKDIADAEKQEMTWLQAYLPAQLSREQIESEARALIAETGANGPRDMGKVMGPLSSKLKGQADGKLISEVVKGLLGG